MLLCVWGVPLGAQHLQWREDERVEEFSIHATVHTVDPPLGQLPLGNVYNTWFDKSGAVWLTSENGLFRWDGISMERLPTNDPTFQGFRPYGLFPLDDGTLILTFTSALLPKSNIQALGLLRPGSKVIEPFPMPLEAGDPKWSFHRSGSGTFLIEHSGAVFVLEVKPFLWRKVAQVDEIPEQAERMVRTVQGVLTWTTRPGVGEEYSWVGNGRSDVILRDIHPVRIPLAGRFDLFRSISLDTQKPLTLITIDPVNGKVDRKAFDGMGPYGDYVSDYFPLVFLTENSNEIWAYNKKEGKLTAADLSTGKVTRRFHVAGILENQPPSCIATRGNDILVGTSSGLVWIRTNPLTLRQQLQEVGSVRTFHEFDGRLFWGTYTGNYLSGVPSGASFPPFEALKRLSSLKGTMIHIHREMDGSFWGGNSDEIYHFDADKGVLSSSKTDFGDPWSIQRWGKFLTLGTDGGVRQVDPAITRWAKAPNQAPPFFNMRVHGFLAGIGGARIAYGENGFHSLEMQGDSIVGSKSILPIAKDLAVFHVYEESPELWWLCTKSGLYALDPVKQEFTHRGLLLWFTGVPTYGAMSDGEGNLWVSTREGLVRINAERNGLYHFGTKDGLSQLEFNRNAFLKLEDGRMLFGGILGAVLLDPKTIEVPGEPEIDSLSFVLRWRGEEVDARSVKGKREFLLPGSAGSVSIDLNGLFLPCPDCRYAWRIPTEGKDWTFGQGRTMDIADIPTGDFLLESWKEVEGHWFRLPDIHIRRIGASSVMHWVTVAGIYIFFLLLLALVGFVYRSQQLPLPSPPVGSNSPADSGKDAADNQDLSEAKSWTDHFEGVLAEHYHDPELKVGRMAAMMSVSERHLLRICREHTGMSPNEFLLDYRLRKAREDIMNNPLSQIAEIAYRSGFQTPTYFSRCFAQKFGKLPSKLQKEVLSGS